MNNGEQAEIKAMTKPPATFWSGETLSQRLKTLIDPFDSGQISEDDALGSLLRSNLAAGA